MALSAEDSAKLLAAIDRLNVSTSVIEEVLQLIRNAQHTGAVDIAEHNNSTGAHANDATLAHITNGDFILDGNAYLGARQELGGTVYRPVSLRQSNTRAVLNLTAKTMGSTSLVAHNLSEGHDAFATDDVGNVKDISSATDTKLLIGFDRWRLLGNVPEQYVYAGWHYYAGMSQTTSVEGLPYASIRPTLSIGVLGAFAQPMEFNAKAIVPTIHNTISLGYNGKAFSDIYCVNAPTITSDRRLKKDIVELDGEETLAFVKALKPVKFKLMQGKATIVGFDEATGENLLGDDTAGTRNHYGLIAQEVKAAMGAAHIDDAALWCLADKNDPESRQSLRYEELIAPMLKVIQMQQERIEALEKKVV